jgi:hypothetical protein
LFFEWEGLIWVVDGLCCWWKFNVYETWDVLIC